MLVDKSTKIYYNIILSLKDNSTGRAVKCDIS